MQARRTLSHGDAEGWSSVAVHLVPASGDKEGFHLTLFPDQRGPVTLFLKPGQMLFLVERARNTSHSDQQIWEEVAKIPMEPLQPCRSLYARLRALLLDGATEIERIARTQLERRPPPPVEAEAEPAPVEGQDPVAAPPKPPSSGF